MKRKFRKKVFYIKIILKGMLVENCIFNIVILITSNMLKQGERFLKRTMF